MRPAAVLICCAAVLLAAAVGRSAGSAEAAPQAGTARDIINRADQSYNAAKYAEAVAGYENFLEGYGKSEEAAPFLPHVRYNLASAVMQTRKFDAAVAVIEEAQKVKELTPEQRENLAFWRAVSLMQTGQNAEARKAFDEFLKAFPNSRHAQDTALYSATLLVASGDAKAAAAAFGKMRQSENHRHRSRAVVLELYSLMQAGDDAGALALLVAEGARQQDLAQIATFQTLALQLGDKLLEAGRPRDAIRALQTVWPRDRLLAHQKSRLEALKHELATAGSRPQQDVVRTSQLRQQTGEIEKELEKLEKIEFFDASLRFRMATAFHQQDRFRESAMLLDDMLRVMPPNPVVEKASLSALQSWMAIDRQDKAIEAAALFEERFPKSSSLPLVMYLRGIAQQKTEQYDDALATFRAVREGFPKSEQATRAFFMEAFTLVLAERNEEAAAVFAEFQKAHPKDELSEAANYWRGSALAFAKKYPEAREVLAAHAEQYPKGNMLAQAAFRHAYCAQSMRDYPLAETELQAYLKKFPEADENNETRILLGDALLAQAKSEEGKAAYAAVTDSGGHFHEEAQFKLAKVLKLEEDYAGLRELMQKYLAAYPRSPRAAEALFLIGQAWREEDQPDKAIGEYWKAINEFGDDPAAFAVEDLFLALGRLYKGESEKRDYLAALRELRERATAEKKPVLVVRSIWALAQAVKKSDPPLSVALLREAGALAKPEVTSPAVLADCAEAQLALEGGAPDVEETVKRRAKAEQIYRDLLKWHPRAVQKDKALGALARLALEQGDTKAALAYYDRLERDTPWSPLMGDVLLTRAKIESDAGKPDEAAAAYTRLLAAEKVSGKLKAQALLALGELEMARNQPQKAVPYYQRIYILYGKWRDTVAKAYLRSGEAFEQLNDREAARKTYEELANSEDLGSLPEAAVARERLQKFGPSTKPADKASS